MKKTIIATLAAATLLSGTLGVSTPTVHAGIIGDIKDTVKDTVSSLISKFKDVKGHWAEGAIAKAIELNLIQGYKDGTFKPNAKITRAEYASLLSRVTGLQVEEGFNPFKDLKGHWAEAAVSKLVSLGFIDPNDYPKGFNPNAELTRFEMMKWISNGLIKSDESFAKAFEETKTTLLPTPETYKGGITEKQIPFIALVFGTGIVGGFEDGSFRPGITTTRAEVTTILLRYKDVEGKKAENYSGLNELREVGVKGTNMESLAKVEWITRNDLPLTIDRVINKKLNFKNGKGSLLIHHYILIDNAKELNGKMRGIYAPMFADKETIKPSNCYTAYVEISVTPSIDISSSTTFLDGVDNVTGYNPSGKAYEKYGLSVKPNRFGNGHEYTGLQDYFRKGVTRRIWVEVYLKKGTVLDITGGDQFSGFILK